MQRILKYPLLVNVSINYITTTVCHIVKIFTFLVIVFYVVKFPAFNGSGDDMLKRCTLLKAVVPFQQFPKCWRFYSTKHLKTIEVVWLYTTPQHSGTILLYTILKLIEFANCMKPLPTVGWSIFTHCVGQLTLCNVTV